MSDLTFLERNQLEKLFDMGGGYVLNFSNRTLQEFIIDSVGKNIYDQRYDYGSGSKANRLRGFWDVESNRVVGRVLRDMLIYAESLESEPLNQQLVEECKRISARLLQSAPVPEIDALVPNADDRNFKTLAKSVREAIDKNEPEGGLDRLHTFVVKYVRNICDRHGIDTSRDKPLHSMFGEYVKHLRKQGRLEAVMTERILKSCISTLEAFNDVRNNKSLAHDNEVLNYHEALLIYTHICGAVRFLQWVEEPPPSRKPDMGGADDHDDVIPF